MPSQSQNTQTDPLSFPLMKIASWTPGVCQDFETKVRASIPALQRGLVWSPQQNELLWDSILRGFPIGAVVVAKYSEQLKKTTETADGSIKYHLLDGQQRCNAIALGFLDPFSAKKSPDGKPVESILWLDINPTLERNSTRNFWVRATTTAHPWGYRKDDVATPLGAQQIRDALAVVKLNPRDPAYRRPSPVELWPCEAAANIPVPLSWLLQLPLDDESEFWNKLAIRAKEAKSFQWALKVDDFFSNSKAPESRIFEGIKRANSARLIALKVPDELLYVSEQERTGSDQEVVSNIELLFQRLNRQGTQLDGEELAYSMIKAYWPEMEEPINKVAGGRMPQARMVSIGVRAALAIAAAAKDTEQEFSEKLPGPVTVSKLREIANPKEKQEISQGSEKHIIQNFIKQDMLNACDLVDKWLKYDKQGNQSGLLPVHVTSIAMNSREVYLLMLCFAKRMKNEPEGWRKAMQALVTLIHWFAPEKAKAANRVYANCRDDMSLENIQLALKEAIDARELQRPHSPEAIETFVKLELPAPADKFESWEWGKLIETGGGADLTEAERESWKGFLNFRENRELLLYAQRDFLARRFHDYDPARKDLWEAHNRPWDFDHILASYYFYNRKDGSTYRGVCGQWGYTIGNLRAWPSEENRSDKADTAADKIETDEQHMDSFLTKEEAKAFSGGDKVRTDEATARAFVTGCMDRLLRIYREWHESVGVGVLVPPEQEK